MSGNCCLSCHYLYYSSLLPRKTPNFFYWLYYSRYFRETEYLFIYLFSSEYLFAYSLQEIAHIITDPEEFSPAICKLKIYVYPSPSPKLGATVQSSLNAIEESISAQVARTGAGRTNSSFLPRLFFPRPWNKLNGHYHPPWKKQTTLLSPQI